MNSSEQLDQLFTALAKAQGEMGIAGRTSSNPFFKSKYADLDEIVAASRPALAKYSLSVLQGTKRIENELVLFTRIGHASGQWIESYIPLTPLKPDPQSLGSYISYMRRYSYASMVGVVVSDEDDDGERSMKREPVETIYINQEQEDQLIRELDGYTELYRTVIEGCKIRKLSELPQHSFFKVFNFIKEKKEQLKTAKK